MSKEEQLKSQTWKYFWQQKAEEVGWFFGIIFGVVLIPFLLGTIAMPFTV